MTSWYYEQLQKDLFDWTVYLALVKERRLQLGYRDAKAFARTIYLRTRVSIPGETYYKIERGSQPLKAVQFLALNIALWGTPWPDAIMRKCIGIDWSMFTEPVYSNTPVPNDYGMLSDWIFENAVDAGLPVPGINGATEEDFNIAFDAGVAARKYSKQDKPLYDNSLIDWDSVAHHASDCQQATPAPPQGAVAIDEPQGKEHEHEQD